MKTLFKILLVIIVMLVMGCNELIKPIKNPEKNTTVEILQLSRDTVIVAITPKKCYVIEDEMVKYELYSGNIGATIVLALVIVIVVLIIALIAVTRD